MDKPQGLKTLGDYRRAAHDPRCALSLYPEGKNGSPYETLKIALMCGRHLISISRANLPEKNWWFCTYLPGTEYEMSNPELFYCVELMEFANTYIEFQSFEKLFPGWPKRADANIRVFTSAGLSYLEAAFSFVRELGGDIILGLQNAYKKYRKEGNIIYWDPIKFLTETPTVDDLEIRPVPDTIIRTWFGDIVNGTQKWIQESNISRFNVEAEFNSIEKQLEYERNTWKKPPGRAGQDKPALPDYRALDLARRTVAIGTGTHPITSEKVWDFLKNLCSAFKDDRLVPTFDGATNNKNNVDRLRKKIGNDALHKLILFVDGGYRLSPEVKILNGAQIGIRRTKTGCKPKIT